MIPDFFTTITVGDLSKVIVGIIVAISAFIEWDKKIPFHPISSLFSWIGKSLMSATTSDINNKLDKLNEQQEHNTRAIIELNEKVENKFKEKQRDDDEKEAKRLRANIICFSDSCRVDTRHTKTHFENIFRDYDDYKAYCDKHEFENHFIESEYEYIQSVYQENLHNNNFL